ncbi:MAG TPA: ABC transporter permease [Vicinamibacterales bacterium]|nr:ABC transporter permease [Vicinamibacterales bacterium]
MNRDRLAELRREIESHIAEATEEFIRRGFSPEEARRAALVSFGGVAQTEEAYRDRLVVRWMDTLRRDLRHATRALVRTPGFSLVVIAILAIGSAAVISVFALLDRVVLQPLPYPNSGRLVAIEHVAPGLKLADNGSSTGLYFYYGEHATSLESLGGYSRTMPTTLTLPNGEIERVQLTRVTASLFRTIGVAPAYGRLFTDEDGAPGFMDARWAIPTLLAHQFWTDRFGGDPAIVGQLVKINDRPRLVVGVMPKGFAFPDNTTQLWMLTEPPRASATFARSFDLRVVARLRGGVTAQTAATELTQLISQVQGVFPDATPERIAEAAVQPIVRPLKSVVIDDIAGALWPLLGGMLLLLTMACANVATLFTGRAEHHRRETAVRLALGASVGQVARSAFIEALLLTLVAAGAGLGLARLALTTTVALAPIALPRVGEIGLDAWSIGVAGTLAVVIAALYSVLAVRGLNRDATGHAVRSGRQLTVSGARTSQRLLAAQVGLALMLMVLSALMVRTYANLAARPLGFAPDGLLTMEVGLPSRLADQHAGIFRDLVDEVRRLPGVTDAGAASFAPLTPVGYNFPLQLSATPVAFKFFVPGYFQAMRTPIVEGAGLATADETTLAMPVLISAPLARRLFGGASPIGQPLHRLERDGSPLQMGSRTDPATVPPFTVAGVVGDVRESSLRDEPAEIVYVPIMEPNVERSVVPTGLTLVVRSAGDPIRLTDAVKAAVRKSNPNLSIGGIRDMSAIVGAAHAQETFVGALLLAAASVAFALGLIGIQGNVAQSVRQRSQEIAIRLALGADRREVVGLVASATVRAVLIGTGAGLIAAVLATPLLGSLLFGVAPRDPLALGLAAASLLTAAIATAWLAGVRATKVSPLRALRGE